MKYLLTTALTIIGASILIAEPLAAQDGPGTNELKLCVTLNGTGLGTVSVANPSQACPVTTNATYLIPVSSPTVPPKLDMTVQVAASGSFSNVSTRINAQGSVLPSWVASSSVRGGVYMLNFADGLFTAAPECTVAVQSPPENSSLATPSVAAKQTSMGYSVIDLSTGKPTPVAATVECKGNTAGP